MANVGVFDSTKLYVNVVNTVTNTAAYVQGNYVYDTSGNQLTYISGGIFPDFQNYKILSISNSVTTPVGAYSKPLLAYITHSYGDNHILAETVLTAQVLDNNGTVQVVLNATLTLTLGYLVRVKGIVNPSTGTSYDCISNIMALNNGTATYSFFCAAAIGQKGQGLKWNISPLGQARMWDLGSGGSTGGYIGASSIAWARAMLRDSIMMPSSYGFYGAGFKILPPNPLFDPGLSGQVANVLNLSPRPNFCLIDLGVNDEGNSTTAQIQAAFFPSIVLLLSAGIKPIVMAIRPRGAPGTLANNKQASAINLYWRNLAHQQLIIFVDSTQRLADWTSAIGAGLTYLYYNGDGLNVHVNCSGAIRDNFAISRALRGQVPPAPNYPYSNADAYDSVQNPYGVAGPTNAGILYSCLQPTVGAQNLTGSLVQIGTSQIFASQAGAGAQTATVAIATRTDKFDDGLNETSAAINSQGVIVPGNEIVITIPPGGVKNVALQYNNSNLYADGSTYAGAGTLASSWYQGGDLLQASCEFSVDNAGIDVVSTVTYAAPQIAITEGTTPASGPIAQITGINTFGATTILAFTSPQATNPFISATTCIIEGIQGNATTTNALNYSANGNAQLTVTAVSSTGAIGNVFGYTISVTKNTTGGTYIGSGFLMTDATNFTGSVTGTRTQFAGNQTAYGVGNSPLASADLAGMSGVAVTPVMQVRGPTSTGVFAATNYQPGPLYVSGFAGYLALTFNVGIAAGTTSGVSMIVRVRNLCIRKIDPVYGEPY